MAQSVNSFLKGLNQDLGKSLQDQASYYDAIDIKLITDEGLSSGLVTNIKGTKLVFQIPPAKNSIKLCFSTWNIIGQSIINVIGSLNGTYGNATFSIDFNFNISPTDSIEAVRDKFKEALGPSAEFIHFAVSGRCIVFTSEIYNLENFVFDQQSLLEIEQTILDGIQNPFILGWKHSAGTIIAIVSDAESQQETPGSNGQAGTNGAIWKFTAEEIDNALRSLCDSDGVVSLSQLTHQIYQGPMNLSRYNEIVNEIIIREENDCTGRAYWTDGYNCVRTINYKNPNARAIPVENLCLKVESALCKPFITDVINGGSWLTGKYYVWYRLIDQDGGATVISPLSNGVVLVADNFNTLYSDYGGSAAGVNSGKSIRVTISNIDLRYTYIEVGVTYYELENVPQSYIVKEDALGSSGTYTTVLSGTESRVAVPSSLLSSLNYFFDTAKTITEKSNYFIPANTCEAKRFDVDFDARAFRFNQSGETALYSIGSINPDTFTSIPSLAETHDAINPYNDESGTVFGILGNTINPSLWSSTFQYKYQSDGSTLGGEGLNIKYEFCTKQFKGDVQNTMIPVYRDEGFQYYLPARMYGSVPIRSILFSKQPAGFSPSVPSIINSTAVNDTVTTECSSITINGWNSMKNPINDSLFAGFARGEVYRFGIVFFNKKGTPSPTKWIGDIKFPEETEIALATSVNTSPQNNSLDTNLLQLGIRFDIDTTTTLWQNIQSQISGYSIVYVPREENDKTRLGIGILNPVERLWEDDSDGETDPDGAFNIPSSVVLSYFGATAYNKAYTFDAPNFHFNQSSPYISGDYIKVLRIVEPLLNYDITRRSNNNNDEKPVITWAKYYNVNRPIGDRHPIKEAYLMNLFANLQSNSLSFSQTRFINVGNPENSTGSNYGSAIDEQQFASVGQKTLLLELDSIQNLFNQYKSLISVDDVDDNGTFQARILASYQRYNYNQYGGVTYTARTLNCYIPASSICCANDKSVCSFYGDTFVNYYDHTKFEANRGLDDTGYETISDGSWESLKIAEGMIYPTESFFNTDFRYGRHFANRSWATEGEAFFYDEFLFNTAHNQRNNIRLFCSDPYDKKECKDCHPYRIWASLNKINGEKIDSWRNFGANDFIDIDGQFGPINKIVSFKNKVYAYQSNGIAVTDVNERAVVKDENSNSLVLGTSAKLSQFQYLSDHTGTIHQYSVIASPMGLYHYDASLHKIFRIGNGIEPLSEVKGLNSFFLHTNHFDIASTDKVLIENRSGVVAAWHPEYEQVLMTFFDRKAGVPLTENNEYTLAYNEYLNSYESFYSFAPSLYLPISQYLISVDFHNKKNRTDTDYNSTIACNRDLLWRPASNNQVYVHNKGIYGDVYNCITSDGKHAKPSYIKILNNDKWSATKTYDNQEFHFETQVNQDECMKRYGSLFRSNNIIDAAHADEANPSNANDLNVTTSYATPNIYEHEFFHYWRYSNDYQHTHETDFIYNRAVDLCSIYNQPLAPVIARRRFRTWRLQIPRDFTNFAGQDAEFHEKTSYLYRPRISDKYIFMEFVFDNSYREGKFNRRFILHPIITTYRPLYH